MANTKVSSPEVRIKEIKERIQKARTSLMKTIKAALGGK